MQAYTDAGQAVNEQAQCQMAPPQQGATYPNVYHPQQYTCIYPTPTVYQAQAVYPNIVQHQGHGHLSAIYANMAQHVVQPHDQYAASAAPVLAPQHAGQQHIIATAPPTMLHYAQQPVLAQVNHGQKAAGKKAKHKQAASPVSGLEKKWKKMNKRANKAGEQAGSFAWIVACFSADAAEQLEEQADTVTGVTDALQSVPSDASEAGGALASACDAIKGGDGDSGSDSSWISSVFSFFNTSSNSNNS